MDEASAERLQPGDVVRHRGEEWTILDRNDRGSGRPHFRLQRVRDGEKEGLTSHRYLDLVAGGGAG